MAASILTVALTSIASRPRRSSLVTIRMSPASPVYEPGKAATLCDGGAAGHRLGDDPVRLDMKAGGFDFAKLVLGRLPGRRDADIGKAAWHGIGPSILGVRNVIPVRNDVNIIFGQVTCACPKSLVLGREPRADPWEALVNSIVFRRQAFGNRRVDNHIRRLA